LKTKDFKKKLCHDKIFKGALGGPGGALRGSLGAPGDLFGGPESTSRSRVATLEGPGGVLGASKNGPRVFF